MALMLIAQRRRPTLAAATVAIALAAPARGEIVFDAPLTLPAGNDTFSVAAADLDEDGNVDLATVGFASHDVRLFFGDGRGGFVVGPAIPVGESPTDLVSADFDADGHADFAVAIFNGRRVSVLFGDGTGGFREIVERPTGTDQPKSLIARDLDGDGTLDLAVVVVGWDVLLAFGDGAGGFGPAGRLSVPSRGTVTSVDSGDYDEDGVVDLSVLTLGRSRRPSEVFVYRGAGIGAFALASRFDVGPSATFSQNHVTSDLDADGHLDMAFLDLHSGVTAHLGDGTGSFAARGPFPCGGPAGGYATRPIAADFSGDGFPDLVIGNTHAHLNLLESDGTGSFLPTVPISAGYYPTGMTAADVDGDHRLDVAVSIGDPFTNAGSLQVFASRTPALWRRGNVNAGAGPVTDVVFVNDSAGGPRREARLLTFVPLSIFVSSPPTAQAAAPFALYVTPSAPDGATSRLLPHGLGRSSMPMLATHGEPRPRAVFNNTGRRALGVATAPSAPAPTVVASFPSGLRRRATFFVQGIIADAGSAASRPASVTNGVLVVVE